MTDLPTPAPGPQPHADTRYADAVSPIDWNALYSALDKLTVTVPEFAPGTPPDLDAIAAMLIATQNRRVAADKFARAIERRMGSAKRELDRRTEMHRLAVLSALGDPSVSSLRTAAERAAAAESFAGTIAAQITVLRGIVHELAAARRAVSMTLASLQAAKETLNGVRAALMHADDLSAGGQHLPTHPGRPRR